MRYLCEAYYELLLSINKDNVCENMIILAICYFAFIFLIFITQLILHEIGHLIFGFITGYQFISFRILCFTLIRENGKFTLKKSNSIGSLGQCLMQPPYNKKANHRLHIMGGVILNASSSIMAMCIVLSSLPISFHGRFILILISFYGLGFSLLNGIPIHIIKISNDGEIFRYLKDKSAAKSYYLQMNVTQKIKNGLTYKNLKEEILYLEKDADLTNAILGWHKVLEGYYYMDLRQWDKAIKCIEIFDNVISEIKQVQRITVLSEKLFIKLFTGNDTGEIETLYEETKEMLRSDKADFHMLRIRFAYEFFMDNSEDNKEKIRREVDELRKSYPYKGEALFCAGLITEMLDKR